jgi:Nif-specific regulatory protein
MRARLIIEEGHGTPSACDLDQDHPVSLGRSHENQIVLHDEHASRWHARISWEEGRWILRDLNTRNGTRVNGVRIGAQAVLADDQAIGIGDIRLRFVLDGAENACITPSQAVGAFPPPIELTGDPGSSESTILLPDELTALYTFMADSVEQSDPQPLVERALQTIVQQTRATLAGFLSLDPDNPLPKKVVPEMARVDVQLSRQLTQKVQREGRAVWLQSEMRETPESDSLMAFNDALCVPLRAEDTPLGALHVYKCGHSFTERDLHFCEILGGHLAGCLRLLRVRRTLEAENSRLRGHALSGDQLIGDSAAMRQVRRLIALAADRPSTVLILGESGVGKELVAQALHNQSPRRKGPFVAVNCAAITETLLEAELFGFRKGAFTGAEQDHPGLFQQADEGTLFLDEIGELSPEFQAKLLRVLEGKGFRPVGASTEIHVDVRVVAATHRNLEEAVREGRFRQDLYFRLRVIPIPIPPLREHAEDIPALVDYFLDKLAVEWRRRVRLTEGVLKRLQRYTWPGNVRQLRMVLEGAVAVSEGNLLNIRDVPLPEELSAGHPPSLNLEDLEAWAIRLALRQSGGTVAQAARLLGIARDTMINKMRRLEIDRDNIDQSS